MKPPRARLSPDPPCPPSISSRKLTRRRSTTPSTRRARNSPRGSISKASTRQYRVARQRIEDRIEGRGRVARLKSLHEIVIGKLAKRNIDLRNVERKDPAISPLGHATQEFVIKQGLEGEKAKEIVKAIKTRELQSAERPAGPADSRDREKEGRIAGSDRVLPRPGFRRGAGVQEFPGLTGDGKCHFAEIVFAATPYGYVCPAHSRPRGGRVSQCERKTMNPIRESRDPSEMRNRREAKGTCVAARRGGKQPGANLRP